jgi:hypothetical protein
VIEQLLSESVVAIETLDDIPGEPANRPARSGGGIRRRERVCPNG